MLILLNYINRKWNELISWFHDFSVKTNIRWLIVSSIWAYDKLRWNLPEKYQLINNIRLSEYKLMQELELAYHQINYYSNYANQLQWKIFEIIDEQNKVEELKEEILMK